MNCRAPLTALLLLLCAGCSHLNLTPTDPVTLNISKQGPWQDQDKILWQQNGQNLEIKINSQAGVGSARLTPAAGAWPSHVRIHLRLNALEGFYATTGSERFEYQLSHEENNQRVAQLAEGKTPEPIEIELPKSLFTDPTTPLIIQWVDFYR